MTMTNNENSPDSLEFGGEHAATPADLQTLNNHNFLIALGGVAARSNQAAAPHFAMPVSRTRRDKEELREVVLAGCLTVLVFRVPSYSTIRIFYVPLTISRT